jgi:hypothetical protein
MENPQQFREWLDIILSMGYMGVAVLLLVRPPEWFTYFLKALIDFVFRRKQ